MLNNWEPFTVIPAGEFKNSKGEMEEFYYVVLKTPGFQMLEQFEGTLQECREDGNWICHRCGDSGENE